MTISGVQSGQNTYNSNFAQKISTLSVKSIYDNSRVKSDVINISEKAKELTQKTKAEIVTEQPDTVTVISSDDLPVEAYSLPGWFLELIPDEALLDDKVGLSMSHPENSQACYESSNGKSKDELDEYLNTLFKYFKGELKNKGIENDVDYYKSIVQDKKMNEEVHLKINTC